MIEIKNLKKDFGPKHVLKDVNLTIPKGETTVILGGSGSGKSTLIKCLIGLEETTSGHILVNGKSLQDNGDQVIKAFYTEFNFLKAIRFNDK